MPKDYFQGHERKEPLEIKIIIFFDNGHRKNSLPKLDWCVQMISVAQILIPCRRGFKERSTKTIKISLSLTQNGIRNEILRS